MIEGRKSRAEAMVYFVPHFLFFRNGDAVRKRKTERKAVSTNLTALIQEHNQFLSKFGQREQRTPFRS